MVVILRHDGCYMSSPLEACGEKPLSYATAGPGKQFRVTKLLGSAEPL